jgi:hypothetical protein
METNAVKQAVDQDFNNSLIGCYPNLGAELSTLRRYSQTQLQVNRMNQVAVMMLCSSYTLMMWVNLLYLNWQSEPDGGKMLLSTMIIVIYIHKKYWTSIHQPGKTWFNWVWIWGFGPFPFLPLASRYRADDESMAGR